MAGSSFRKPTSLVLRVAGGMARPAFTRMRKSRDGNLQLNAEETAKLEASLRGVVTEARSMMLSLKTPQPTSDER